MDESSLLHPDSIDGGRTVYLHRTSDSTKGLKTSGRMSSRGFVPKPPQNSTCIAGSVPYAVILAPVDGLGWLARACLQQHARGDLDNQSYLSKVGRRLRHVTKAHTFALDGSFAAFPCVALFSLTQRVKETFVAMCIFVKMTIRTQHVESLRWC